MVPKSGDWPGASIGQAARESKENVTLVIPGRAKREPGIHNHERGLWIPGLRPRGRIPE